ncbi:MAG: type II toxin-antitoxin system prevent-host-death family antitoxin [Bacilli bacterium]
MPSIRPSSDLRNKYSEISDFCNKYNEPVFITKNGTGDLVVLSNTEYDRLCGKQELHKLLEDGLAVAKLKNGRNANDVLSEIERKFTFGEV